MQVVHCGETLVKTQQNPFKQMKLNCEALSRKNKRNYFALNETKQRNHFQNNEMTSPSKRKQNYIKKKIKKIGKSFYFKMNGNCEIFAKKTARQSVFSEAEFEENS